MKRAVLLVSLVLSVLLHSNTSYGQYHGMEYWIGISNSCPFDLLAEGMPEDGEGIFESYKPVLKKNTSFIYHIKNANAFKGVEGHLKFKAYNGEKSGYIDIYFDNPAVGSPSFTISATGAFTYKHILPPASKRIPNLDLEISLLDSTGEVHPINVTGEGNTTGGAGLPIPPVINFEWQVIQRMPKDEDDRKDGKGYKTVTYYFMTDGSYAAIKPDDDEDLSLMIYAKDGSTWMFNDQKKIITVMNMPKTVTEGGMLGKRVAEDINKSPIPKNAPDKELFVVTKTGKTKTVLGLWKAEEYQVTNKSSSKMSNAAASYWYITAPFEPVKIYTMGVGRPKDLTKLQNDPRMKNNIMAIPVLNKNYLWVEMEAGGLKGLETTDIRRTNTTIYTAGYKIKNANGLKDLIKSGIDNE